MLLQNSFTVNSPFNTILVLTVLSELTKIGLGSTLDGALDRLQWMLLAQKRGAPFLDYLALDRGTSKLGLLGLIFLRRKAGHSYSAIRLVAALAIAALSVILLSNVSGDLKIVSEPSFPIAAGVGDFNGSWVKGAEDFAALQFQASLDRFLTDSTKSIGVDPVVQGASLCRPGDPFVNTDACKASYFVAGGLELVTPWPGRNQDLLDRSVYSIYDVQGLQLDFSGAVTGDNATLDEATHCIVSGSDDEAVQICVAKQDTNVMFSSTFQMSSCTIFGG